MDPKQCAFDHAPHTVIQTDDGSSAYVCPACHARWILSYYDDWVLTTPPDILSDSKNWELYISARRMEHEARLGQMRAEAVRHTVEFIDSWLVRMADTIDHAGEGLTDAARINDETIMVINLIQKIREEDLHHEIDHIDLFNTWLEPDEAARISERKLRAVETILGAFDTVMRRNVYTAALRMAASEYTVRTFKADVYEEISRDSGLIKLERLLRECNADQIIHSPGEQEEFKKLDQTHNAYRETRIKRQQRKKKQLEEAYHSRYIQVRILLIVFPVLATIASLLILAAVEIHLPRMVIMVLLGLSVLTIYFSDLLAHTLTEFDINPHEFDAWDPDSDKGIMSSSRKTDKMRYQTRADEQQWIQEAHAGVNAARQTVETARDSLAARLGAIADQEIKIHEDRMIVWCGEMLDELPDDLRPVSYQILELYQ